MTNRFAFAFSAATLLLGFAACGGNNVGRLFDPEVGGPGGAGDGTGIEAVPVGGKTVEGRPRVINAFPTGSNWPASVPIVIVFNESIAEDSIEDNGTTTTAAPADDRGDGPVVGDAGDGPVVPSDGFGGDSPVVGDTGQGGTGVPGDTGTGDGATTAPPPTDGIFARVVGTQTPIPAAFDLLLGGTVVVMRPTAALTVPDGGQVEVLVGPELRDVDGTRFGGSEPEVVATFTPNADAEAVDGEIVTTLPIDNEGDALRETPIYAIFSRAANAQSVTTGNFVTQTAGGILVNGNVSFPIEAAPQVPDTRILRFDPAAALFGATDYEIFVDSTIQFGETGVLEFQGRSPFSVFSTIAAAQATSVAVGNAATGFPDKVNLGNIANLMIDVVVPADAIVGDTLRVRLYGLENETEATDDLNFVERTASVPANGEQTVTVDFSGALGLDTDPRFDDGSLIVTVQTERGSELAGYIRSSALNTPEFDVTPPTLTEIGPPMGPNATDIICDQQHLVMYGTASERLGLAEITVNGVTANLFASDDAGRFTIYPVDLGVLGAGGATYALSLTDTAGNLVASALSGAVRQRGVVSGGVLTGTLVVEAYDEATYEPLVGAAIVIEPGVSQKPAVGQLTAITGADGRATFSGLGSARYTITVVAADHDLVTLVDNPSAFVSLPVPPTTGATATLTGSAAFVPSAGATALIGLNTFADPTTEALQTAAGNAGTIQATQIRPNRPIVATALSGVFPPTAVSTFANFGCGMCGQDSLTLTPPFAPAEPLSDNNIALTLIPATGSVANLAATYTVDFGTSGGLGTIQGAPSVNILASMLGFGGMTLYGVGFATAGVGAQYTINGSYALRLNQTLALFTPTLWVSTEATDASGNIARQRRLIVDPTTGTTFNTTAAPGIPTVSTPAGAITGSPAVSFQDRLNSASLLGGFAFTQLRAADPNGRDWLVLLQDISGANGATTLQFPDLSGTGLVGLSTGSWSIGAEHILMFTNSYSSTSYVLEERFRQLVTYGRAQAVAHVIQ